MHEQLVEGIVVGDDDLMERYLNGETIDYAELEKSLAGGVASGAVFPVLCCSAAQWGGGGPAGAADRGAVPAAGVPAPRAWRRPAPPTQMVEVACDVSGPTVLTVTKTYNDGHTGKMSLCKVVSGTLAADAVLVNTRTREEERLHALQSLAGHAGSAVSAAVAGDFVAVPRLNGTHTGDTLAVKGQPISVVPPSLPAGRALGGGEAGDPGRRRQADVGAAAAVRRGPFVAASPGTTRRTRPSWASRARSTWP